MSEELRTNNWEVIIGGDFNAKLGKEYPGFPSNISAEVNDNGRILKDLITHLSLNNFFNWRWGGGLATYYCQGSTRGVNNQTGIRSVLDNILWTPNLPVDYCYNSEIGVT